MTSEHVDGRQALLGELRDPAEEIAALASVEGVEDQARKEKVVDGEAPGGHLFVEARAVLCMDLRKDDEIVLLGDLLEPLQILPCARGVEEIGLPGSLCR